MIDASSMKLALANLIAASLLGLSANATAQINAPVDNIRTDLVRGEAHASASPALNDGTLTPKMLAGKEVEALLSGNTLRRNDRLAIYFAPGGGGTAWGTDWVAVKSARCPASDKPGDAYDRRDGSCRSKTIYTVSHTWWTDKDRLCNKWVEGGAEKSECWLVGVLYDRVLLFKDGGQGLEGLPMDLRAGKALAQASD